MVCIVACWACSYVKVAKADEQSGPDGSIVPAKTVDSIVQENVLLMKIDVEGFEVNALKSAQVPYNKLFEPPV
jgi:FkbM family methyltransferase